MAAKNALVLAGDGINCHNESAHACIYAGFQTSIVHVNDFLAAAETKIKNTSMIVLPGGFSFGDELGSGRILALKLRHRAGTALEKFLENGGAMLGICNGFQTLVAMGVFGPSVALAHNASGRFIDRWTTLRIVGRSIFTDALNERGTLDLPIRHGEGRLICTDSSYWQKMRDRQELVLEYEGDVNGSKDLIAGLSAYDGRVLGLMPHPEAFWSHELHPDAKSYTGPLGVEMFRAAHAVLSQ